MQNKWLQCFVAVLCSGVAACQKDPAPSNPETVTQSAKPTAGEAANASAGTATAKAGQNQPAATGAPSEGSAQGTASGSTAIGATSELQVGSDAPEVTLTLQNGKSVPLSSLEGKQVVLYFYPKDDTPGCTVEAQGIRDQWEAFEKAGIAVYGVSMQDAASHSAFIEKHKLPFDLAVDTDGTLTKAFGVPVSGGSYAARHTFLIGADGKIKQIWRSVNPAEHAKELLEAAGASPAAAPDAPKAG